MQDAAAVQVSNGGRDAAGDAQDLFEAETLLGTVAVARAAGQRGWPGQGLEARVDEIHQQAGRQLCVVGKGPATSIRLA